MSDDINDIIELATSSMEREGGAKQFDFFELPSLSVAHGQPQANTNDGDSASPFMTTEEAASYLRLAGPSSVRSLIARGELVADGKAGRRGSYCFRCGSRLSGGYQRHWLSGW